MGIIIFFLVLLFGTAGVAYFVYQRTLRKAKGVERGLKMVPIRIHLPPASQTDGEVSDPKEQMRQKIAQAEVIYNVLAGTATSGFKSNFYGQRHLAFEIIATEGNISFYAAIPVALLSVVEQAIQSAYPGATLEQTEDHNLFNAQSKIEGVAGGELELKKDKAYPLKTYKTVERDPLEAILNTLSGLKKGDGIGIQLMLRPAGPAWLKSAKKLADGLRSQRHGGMKFTAGDFVKAAVKAPKTSEEIKQENPQLSNLELAVIEAVEEKTRQPAYEALIRVVASSDIPAQATALVHDISTAFALFEDPSLNGFQFVPARDKQGLVTAFIFRFFPPELNSMILGSQELATLFHLPESRFTQTTEVARQAAKQADAPTNISKQGVLLGYNEFRGQRQEIRLDENDRRRHVYIVGQTGTGKSTMLETIAVQDMLEGRGFMFIDPHGDASERLLSLVPKARSEDVVYFNPADTENPLGLNLFEFQSPDQKDFIIQESINMLYRLYDPGRTGIIGPRYEHWFRNAALTLMSDPNGSTFVEVPKVFTDTDFLKAKFKHVTDPTVIDFWTKEMASTSDFHKSEVLGWFVSKFGAFVNNEMMRNILGQPKSSFNLREIMDGKKILIVNLSKGRVGELNSQLLGMILVTKIQAAAMSRAEIAEEQRSDFSLIVDEFQNFSTDSFASILSEARKYRLNLVVANQFIGQLNPQVRDAVFGNVGTMMSFRTGPEDADFLVKQFAPVFEQQDLVNLPNFYAVTKLMVGGLPSQPFSMLSLPPVGTGSSEMQEAVKQLSSAKFGRQKDQVGRDILTRMGSLPALKPVPEPEKAESPAPSQPDRGEATLSLSSFKQAQPTPQEPSAETVLPTNPAPMPAAESIQSPAQPDPGITVPPEPTPEVEVEPLPGDIIQPEALAPEVPVPPEPTPATNPLETPAQSTQTPGEIQVDEQGNVIQNS